MSELQTLISTYAGERKYSTMRVRDGVHIIETRQDCEPIIDWVKSYRDQYVRDDVFTHVARIPTAIIGQAMNEGWFHDEAAWKRWLNAPENECFRIWQGSV